MPLPLPDKPRDRPVWYETRQFRRISLLLLAIVALVEGYFAIVVRENDFVWHLNMGQAFLSGEPYGRSGEWYPVGRAMFDAVGAAMNYYVARTIFYLAALGALVGSWLIWKRLADEDSSGPATSPAIAFAAGVLAFWLAFSYVLRDLDECGLQILLLFCLSAAAWAMRRGQNGRTGFWLALAATYKVTPILFLPYLLWRRSFRPAAWTLLWIVALNFVAPSVWLGWNKTLESNRQWLAHARRSIAIEDPSQNAVEPPKPQNLSLQVAIARFLQTYPEGNPLRVSHAGYVDFGNLDAPAAKTTVTLLLLVLAALLAWRFWRPVGIVGEGPFSVYQWAAVCALVPLMSPLCWKQHLVMVLPSLFLSLRWLMVQPRKSRWRLAALALFGVIVLGLRRGIVGRELSILMLSYKLDTGAVLLAVLLVLTFPKRALDAVSAADASDVGPGDEHRLPAAA